MTYCVLDTECCVYDKAAQLPGQAIGRYICHGCAETAARVLNQLRLDYVDLSNQIPNVDARNEVQIFRPKPESSPPINMAVYTLRGEIAWFIAAVALVLRRHVGSPVTHYSMPVREGFRLDHDIRWLVERTDQLAGLPAVEFHWDPSADSTSLMNGGDVLLHLHRLHNAARRSCGTDSRNIIVPGHCLSCGTASLRRKSDDTDKIWCVHCRAAMDSAAYNNAVQLRIDGSVTRTG